MRFLTQFLAFCIVICLPVKTLAQENTANGTLFGDWRLACEAAAVNTTVCVITQTLSLKEGNQFLAEVTLQVLQGKEEPKDITVMAMTTPTNMRLTIQPGYRVGDSGPTLPLTWRTCGPEFCTASRVLDPSEVDALRNGLTFALGYHPVSRPEPLVFMGSLTGASAGLDALTP